MIDPQDSPPPIPEYELLALVGRGSYGDVWLGRGLTGVLRAIKVVWRDRFQDDDPYLSEFSGLQEFAAVSLIEQGQLAVLHVGRNDEAGFFYYVMEAADDASGLPFDPTTYAPHTLAESCRRRGRIPASQAVAIATDLASALAGLHARGLVHGDIKPSNVIFVGGGVKLADIGSVASAGASSTGAGTAGFVPSEGPGSTAADIYSLGKLFYEMVMGLDRKCFPRLPKDFHQDPDHEVLRRLNRIIVRCCEPSASRRFADAASLLHDLRTLQFEQAHPLRRRRHLRPALGLLAAALGAVLLLRFGPFRRIGILREEGESLTYSAGLTRSQLALELGDTGRARRELQALIPPEGSGDPRGFEWEALMAEARDDPFELLETGTNPVRNPRFSPDGELFSLQEGDAGVSIWQTDTRERLASITGLRQIAGFSSDGTWLVGVDRAGRLRRWQARTGNPEDAAAPAVDRAAITSILPDEGAYFLRDSGNRGARIAFWDFSNEQDVDQVELNPAGPGTGWNTMRVATSADRRRAAFLLATTRAQVPQWEIAIVDLETRQLVREEPLSDCPGALTLSGDGSICVLAMNRLAEVQAFRTSNWSPVWRRSLTQAAITTLAWDGRSDRIAAAGDDHFVYLLDARTGETTAQLRGHPSAVSAVAWSPGGVYLVSTGSDGSVRFWRDLSTNPSFIMHWPPRPAEYGPTVLELSADGRLLALSRGDRPMEILSVSDFSALGTLPQASIPLSFQEDGSLLTLLPDGRAGSWAVDDPEEESGIFRLLPDRPPAAVAISPNHEWLASADDAGGLTLWNSNDRQMVRQISKAAAEPVTLLALSPLGDRLASVAGLSHVQLWDTTTGSIQAEIRAERRILSIAMSPDGSLLAFGMARGVMELHRTRDLEAVRELHTDCARINAVVFSPDGRRLIGGGASGLIYIYSTVGWHELTVLPVTPVSGSGNAAVEALAFSDDGRTLAAGLTNGGIRIWQ